MRRTNKTVEWDFTQLKELKRTFEWERNRNHPTIKVDMYLKFEDGKIVFSCVGQISLEAGGQCEDDIDKYLKWDKVWDKIYYLWKTHHLNDMHAGTPKQENLIKMGRLAGVDLSSYDKELDFLREYYVECDELDGEPYKYGTKWLYRPIPETDLWEILSLLLED